MIQILKVKINYYKNNKISNKMYSINIKETNKIKSRIKYKLNKIKT
jgi:hypothetical protein